MYSPRIREDLVKKLYKLKHEGEGKKRPMTRMVNEAIEKYLKEEIFEETIKPAGNNSRAYNRDLEGDKK